MISVAQRNYAEEKAVFLFVGQNH